MSRAGLGPVRVVGGHRDVDAQDLSSSIAMPTSAGDALGHRPARGPRVLVGPVRTTRRRSSRGERRPPLGVLAGLERVGLRSFELRRIHPLVGRRALDQVVRGRGRRRGGRRGGRSFCRRHRGASRVVGARRERSEQDQREEGTSHGDVLVELPGRSAEGMNRSARQVQSVDATSCASRSAGVSHPRVSRGRLLS